MPNSGMLPFGHLSPGNTSNEFYCATSARLGAQNLPPSLQAAHLVLRALCSSSEAVSAFRTQYFPPVFIA